MSATTQIARPSDLLESSYDFENVQYYCMFLCHARSGHSLFSSILDAHPKIIIAQELNALKLIQRGASREELFRKVVHRSRDFTRIGRRWNGYDYRVPNQWQGCYEKLTVIGDKKGAVSIQLLRQDAQLLSKLRLTVGVPVKIFRVIRNPFDNIRTLARWYHGNSLNPAIRGYFSLCAAVEKIKTDVKPEDWMDVYHEKLIAEPEQTLQVVCRFLGVETMPDYLRCCASCVFKSPRQRRHEVKWTQEQREQVERGIQQYEHLSRYAFES